MKENGFFPETIFASALSERISKDRVRSVLSLPLVFQSSNWYSPEQAGAAYRYHCELVNALLRRDGQRAEFVIRERVDDARGVLVAPLKTTAREAG